MINKGKAQFSNFCEFFLPMSFFPVCQLYFHTTATLTQNISFLIFLITECVCV